MRLFQLLADACSVNRCRSTRLVPVSAITAVAIAASVFAAVPNHAAAQAFGGAVLIAGDYILVGEAAHEREPGTVRAYALAGGGWAEVATLQGPGASVRDAFGRSLAQAGDFLLVGAGGGDGGRVHVYRLADVGNPEAAPVQTLAVSGLGGFGGAMAASAADLVVTARERRTATARWPSFRRERTDRWSHRGTLTLEGRVGFGGAGLVLDGDLLVAGNPSAGTVSVFERASGGAGWGDPAVLERPASDEGAGSFGTTIAAHGGEVLVSEMRVARSPDRGVVRTGTVHRFAKVDGAWASVGTVTVGEEQSQGVFGSSLTVRGGTLLVGDGSRGIRVHGGRTTNGRLRAVPGCARYRRWRTATMILPVGRTGRRHRGTGIPRRRLRDGSGHGVLQRVG